jgi:hypothetical protein
MLNAVKNVAVDALSLVWLELLMFGFAVVTYLIFTGGYVTGSGKTTKKSLDSAATDDYSPASSTSRSVRVRAASPPAAERKEKDEVDISKHVAMMRARSKEQDLEGAMQLHSRCA